MSDPKEIFFDIIKKDLNKANPKKFFVSYMDDKIVKVKAVLSNVENGKNVESSLIIIFDEPKFKVKKIEECYVFTSMKEYLIQNEVFLQNEYKMVDPKSENSTKDSSIIGSSINYSPNNADVQGTFKVFNLNDKRLEHIVNVKLLIEKYDNICFPKAPIEFLSKRAYSSRDYVKYDIKIPYYLNFYEYESGIDYYHNVIEKIRILTEKESEKSSSNIKRDFIDLIIENDIRLKEDIFCFDTKTSGNETFLNQKRQFNICNTLENLNENSETFNINESTKMNQNSYMNTVITDERNPFSNTNTNNFDNTDRPSTDFTSLNNSTAISINDKENSILKSSEKESTNNQNNQIINTIKTKKENIPLLKNLKYIHLRKFPGASPSIIVMIMKKCNRYLTKLANYNYFHSGIRPYRLRFDKNLNFHISGYDQIIPNVKKTEMKIGEQDFKVDPKRIEEYNSNYKKVGEINQMYDFLESIFVPHEYFSELSFTDDKGTSTSVRSKFYEKMHTHQLALSVLLLSLFNIKEENLKELLKSDEISKITQFDEKYLFSREINIKYDKHHGVFQNKLKSDHYQTQRESTFFSLVKLFLLGKYSNDEELNNKFKQFILNSLEGHNNRYTINEMEKSDLMKMLEAPVKHMEYVTDYFHEDTYNLSKEITNITDKSKNNKNNKEQKQQVKENKKELIEQEKEQNQMTERLYHLNKIGTFNYHEIFRQKKKQEPFIRRSIFKTVY